MPPITRPRTALLPLVALLALSLFIAAPARATPPNVGTRRVVAYYIEWGIYDRNYQPASIPAGMITHLNYAFANIGADGRIQQGDSYAATERYYPGDTAAQPFRGTYNQINNVIKPAHPHLKTLISVGGWGWSGRFSDVALTPASRGLFAQSCVAFLRQYHWDGLDVDWEFPVCCGLASNTYRPQDRQNFTLLLHELRTQLNAAGVQDGRQYLLTIAAPAGYDVMPNYEIAAIAAEVDWVNVMAYDFAGSWQLTTGHHAAFDANPAAPFTPLIRDRYNTHWSLDAWNNAGVPVSKLVMGVPFYGHAWGGVPAGGAAHGLFQTGSSIPPGTWDGDAGLNDYSQIQQFIAAGGYTRYWDAAAQAPYAFNPAAYAGHFITFDDAQSLAVKTQYIRQRGLAGVMIWEITADRNQTLLNAVVAGLSPCAADFNRSGGPNDGVTVQDIYDFLSAWSAADPRANFNGAGGITVQDIYDFLAAWNAGCP